MLATHPALHSVRVEAVQVVAIKTRTATAMFSMFGPGDRVDVASIAQRCQRSASSSLKALEAKDATVWPDLLTVCDDAASEFVATQPPVFRSLIFVRGLKNATMEMKARGPTYPFVYGDVRSNGLLTAVRFVLDNTAIALYTSGNPSASCISTATPGGKVRHVLEIVRELEQCVLTSSHERHYRAYVNAAAHAVCANIDTLCLDLRKLVRLAYLRSVSVGKFHLSQEMVGQITEACTEGTASSRAGRLVLMKLDYEVQRAAKVFMKEVPEECDDWARIDETFRLLDLPINFMFK